MVCEDCYWDMRKDAIDEGWWGEKLIQGAKLRRLRRERKKRLEQGLAEKPSWPEGFVDP